MLFIVGMYPQKAAADVTNRLETVTYTPFISIIRKGQWI